MDSSSQRNDSEKLPPASFAGRDPLELPRGLAFPLLGPVPCRALLLTLCPLWLLLRQEQSPSISCHGNQDRAKSFSRRGPVQIMALHQLIANLFN